MDNEVMDAEAIDIVEAPETCEDTIEYDNQIEDEFEVEPEEEDDQETTDSNISRQEIEHQFARYELNYRARRIRELTTAPIKKKSRSHAKSKALAA